MRSVSATEFGLHHYLHWLFTIEFDNIQEFVRFVIGDGLVSAPAKEHAKQRRIMGPAFTQAHIKQISPIFTEKAEELSNKIAQIVKKGGQSRWNTKREDSVVNVTELLDCASFDIIGKAGFGVDFEVRLSSWYL